VEYTLDRFKELLEKTEVAIMGYPVKGSLTYLPYGFSIRQRLYDLGISLLHNLGFKQIILSDYIDLKDLLQLDKVSKISNKYYSINDCNFVMVAGHEIPFYVFIRHLLHNKYQKKYNFPLKYFIFDSVYRKPKNTKFPFNLGERKSFLECYTVHKTSLEACESIAEGVFWNKRFLQDILHLPSIEVERPLITNSKFSRKTICIDSITPLGQTVISGMTYFHDDIFTKALNVKYRNPANFQETPVYSTHFGVSENIFFSYLLNSFDKNGLKLLSTIAPIQISVLYSHPIETTKKSFKDLLRLLDSKGIRYAHEATDDMYKVVKTNNLKGIPITLIIKKNAIENIMCIRIFYNGKQENVNYENIIEIIEKAFAENDKSILEKFKCCEINGILDCINIREVNSVVGNGKVAKAFCCNDDKTILHLESLLNSGEILGFKENNICGRCIINNTVTNTIAFISKRS